MVGSAVAALAAERVQASVGIVESAIYAGVLAFPGLEVLGEVQQADLLELGRAVERRAVLDLGVVGRDRVEDRVALLLGAPVGHGEDRVVPVGVGRALIAVRDPAVGGHPRADLGDVLVGDL